MIRLSALGDILFALEAVASLKTERPDVLIDFLVEDRFADLLTGHPQLERVLVFPRRRWRRLPASLAALRAVRYDAVLDLHGILKSAGHLALARARRKLGYAPPAAREGAHRLYPRAVPIVRPLHRADRGYELLRALGLRAAGARPMLAPPEKQPLFWTASERPRLVLHPGTSAFAEFKRWPAEHFAELARRLRSRALPVAVSFGPGERALAERIAAAAPGARLLDGGALGLRGLAAVFATTDVVVAADTGPLHVAAAAGARVVALFGPKDASLYGPRGAGHAVLSRDVPCRPCRRRTCPSPLCVLGIGVGEVEAMVLAQVGSDASRSGVG
jgi:lipopolysaccharide heptosyltransferase I